MRTGITSAPVSNWPSLGEAARPAASRYTLSPFWESSRKGRRVSIALNGTLGTTYGPTRTHRRSYEIAKEEYAQTIGALKTLVERELPGFERRLDEAGVRWTAGRPIPRLED